MTQEELIKMEREARAWRDPGSIEYQKANRIDPKKCYRNAAEAKAALHKYTIEQAKSRWAEIRNQMAAKKGATI